jgi:hypothetical protein
MHGPHQLFSASTGCLPRTSPATWSFWRHTFSVENHDVTAFAMSVGEILVGRDPAAIAEARTRAAHTIPAILGFAVGCGLGAAYESAIGLRSLALPVGLALLAFFIGFAAPDARRR